MLNRKVIVLDFSNTEEIKIHIYDYVTLSGVFHEIVYLDLNEKPYDSIAGISIADISGIWLNSHRGKLNNHKFSVLLTGDAMRKHITEYGLLTNSEIEIYIATCNDVLLESQTGTEKPYVRISDEDDLEKIRFIKNK